MSKRRKNKKFKDSVFVDLFQTSEYAKENSKSLVRWVKGLRPDWDGEVRRIRIEDTLYMNFKNDVSYITEDALMVLAEHQSTINPNMPLRYLLYAAKLYEKIIPTRERFRTSLVKIPKPEFYVFYNGIAPMPLISKLSLKDAFHDAESILGSKVDGIEGGFVDLTVTVININSEVEGRKNEFITDCPVLWEYSEFCERVRENKIKGMDDPFENAIKDCINDGILSDYLKDRGSEVVNMLTAEYDYNEDIAVKQEDAMSIGFNLGMEQGLEQGLERGIEQGLEQGVTDSIRKLRENMNISTDEAMNYLGIPDEDRNKYSEKL